MVKPEISHYLQCSQTKGLKAVGVVNEEGTILITWQEWPCFSAQEQFLGVAWRLQGQPQAIFPLLPYHPLLGPGGPRGLSFCCPSSSSHEILLAPFRPFSFWDGGGRKAEVFEGLFSGHMCVCVIVISFGWCQNEPESACHQPWMLLMVPPMRKEEGRRGDRVPGGMPVLTWPQVSAVDSL